MTPLQQVGIWGVGKSVPDKIVKNDDFVAMGLDTSDEWITSRTGIRERRIAGPDIATSDLAYEASKKALAHANLTADQLDLIIVATTSPDHLGFPSVACLLQNRLGARNIGAFDVAAACTGFNYALTVGMQFIQTGYAKHVLVVGADCLSKWVDWTDRSICVLFGDGAGAVILGPEQAGFGILSSKLYSEGKEGPILCIPSGGTRTPMTAEHLADKSNFIYMDGKAVFKVAVSTIVPAVEAALEAAHLQKSDIQYFIPHQANLRIIDYAREKLGLRKDQTCITLNKYGNTSAASIPITLAEAVESGKIKHDDIIATVGFGAGFTWGTSIIKWSTQHG